MKYKVSRHIMEDRTLPPNEIFDEFTEFVEGVGVYVNSIRARVVDATTGPTMLSQGGLSYDTSLFFIDHNLLEIKTEIDSDSCGIFSEWEATMALLTVGAFNRHTSNHTPTKPLFYMGDKEYTGDLTGKLDDSMDHLEDYIMNCNYTIMKKKFSTFHVAPNGSQGIEAHIGLAQDKTGTLIKIPITMSLTHYDAATISRATNSFAELLAYIPLEASTLSDMLD